MKTLKNIVRQQARSEGSMAEGCTSSSIFYDWMPHGVACTNNGKRKTKENG